MQKKNVSDLLDKSVNAFSNRNEIFEIYSFGSASKNQLDKYSDVDLTVVTNDIEMTTKELTTVLSKIDKVATIFTIAETEDSVAYTIFFQNYPLYQKLDLGIVSVNFKNQLFSGSRLEFKNEKPSGYLLSRYFSRLESSPDHDALDCIIGSLRYLKHLKRKEIWPAYKFYKSFIEQYLRLKLKTQATKPFTLEDFKAIQKQKEKKLTKLIFNKSEIDMSHTYLLFLNKYYSLCKNKISNKNRIFIEKVIAFWTHEIKDIYKK